MGIAIKMKLSAIIVLTAFAFTSCVTGEKFSQLHPGMTKAQVLSLLGNPKGYEQNGQDETLQYPGGLISGWSYDTADFYVTLHNGVVQKYGASNVQKGQHPTTVVVLPQS
jgi:SmpA/OmlA family protein